MSPPRTTASDLHRCSACGQTVAGGVCMGPHARYPRVLWYRGTLGPRGGDWIPQWDPEPWGDEADRSPSTSHINAAKISVWVSDRSSPSATAVSARRPSGTTGRFEPRADSAASASARYASSVPTDPSSAPSRERLSPVPASFPRRRDPVKWVCAFELCGKEFDHYPGETRITCSEECSWNRKSDISIRQWERRRATPTP